MSHLYSSIFYDKEQGVPWSGCQFKTGHTHSHTKDDLEMLCKEISKQNKPTNIPIREHLSRIPVCIVLQKYRGHGQWQ